MGKSRLIREACNHRNVITFRAAKETARLNFQAFRRTCLQHMPDCGLEMQDDWQGLLAAVAAVAQPGLVLVLDNFSMLTDADETLPFIIRDFCRAGHGHAARLKLILCGDNIARMTALTRGASAKADHALADCDPQLFDLTPLPLHEAAGFFPSYTPEARIAAYAIFGGVPAYLAACDAEKPLAANIVDLLMTPDGRLVDEPLRALAHDLRDVKVYASILRAIANGHRESGEIRSFVMGAQTGMSISSYLEKLRAMRLIKGARALDADAKSRNMRFTISDPLTRFWNLFVQPNRGIIERDGGRELFETTIRRQLGDYMILGFETICRGYVRNQGDRLFGVRPQAVGQLWGQGYNIPIAARQYGRGALLGACAWQTQPVGGAGYAHLTQQARLSGFGPEDDGHPPDYALFSRSGFSSDLEAVARQSPHLKLVAPADMLHPAS